MMPKSTFSPESLPSLSNKVFLVTGGNTGCGLATVEGLASRGAKVYMGARSEAKALAAIEEIKTKSPSATNVHFLQLDLASFASVIAAAKFLRSQEPVLHGLVNNAGIMGVPFSMTDDGYEVQFQTNYLSHWLLTFHLLPMLSAASASSTPARLVNVTSDGHELLAPKTGINFDDLSMKESRAMTRYGQSKLANILHAKELHRRYGPKLDDKTDNNKALYVAAVHPGHIDTNLNKQATGAAPSFVLRVATPIMRCVGVLDDSSKGAWSSLFAIASNEFKPKDSGAYVVPYAKIGTPSKHAEDGALALKLWQWTEGELGQKGHLAPLS